MRRNDGRHRRILRREAPKQGQASVIARGAHTGLSEAMQALLPQCHTVVDILPASTPLHILWGPDAAIAFVSTFSERTNDLSNGLIWPKDGSSLERLCRNGRREFLPLGEAHSSRTKKRAPLPSSALLRSPSDAAALASGLSIAIEVAWCGLGNEENGD